MENMNQTFDYARAKFLLDIKKYFNPNGYIALDFKLPNGEKLIDIIHIDQRLNGFHFIKTMDDIQFVKNKMNLYRELFEFTAVVLINPNLYEQVVSEIPDSFTIIHYKPQNAEFVFFDMGSKSYSISINTLSGLLTKNEIIDILNDYCEKNDYSKFSMDGLIERLNHFYSLETFYEQLIQYLITRRRGFTENNQKLFKQYTECLRPTTLMKGFGK